MKNLLGFVPQPNLFFLLCLCGKKGCRRQSNLTILKGAGQVMEKKCFSFMRSGSLFNVCGGKLTGFWCTFVLLLLGAVSAVNSASLFASVTPQISGGASHSLSLKSDGTVWAWGKNDYGQLGDGTTTQRSTPVQVSSLSGVIAVADGDYHSLAVKSDGTVWAWGIMALANWVTARQRIGAPRAGEQPERCHCGSWWILSQPCPEVGRHGLGMGV